MLHMNCVHVLLLHATAHFGGCRSICRLLQQRHKMIVPHKTVRLLLRYVDPVKVHNRRHHHLQRRTYSSRGPNDTWHTDGYDKPRPHGILISSCVTHSEWVVS